jgi:EAL domain-containing protein (putative c-di-GMP-specific phosphodiesterase class I)
VRGRTPQQERSQEQDQIAGLLRTAKRSLRLSVAFLSRLDGTTQHLEVVESSVPFLFREGATQVQETSFCQGVLDGRLPAVIPDVRRDPEAMRLPAARLPRIRSFVSVPVRFSDGTLYGTFCAAGLTSDAELGERDRALMEVLADAASVVLEPGVRAHTRRAELEARLLPLAGAGGPEVVLQPIVDLATGGRVGAEALSRFPRAWGLTPDVCFAEAHEVGVGVRMELLAVHRALGLLDVVDGYVAVNVSPRALLTPACADVLGAAPLDRVVLELSEHDPVEDYDALLTALTPLREGGLRLAVDDVGAGFASLRHVLVTRPDVLKLDRSLVDGVADDPVRRELVRSLATFGHGGGAVVVAEGVETARDADACLGLGVDLGQGWHFGRPGPPGALAPAARMTGPHAGRSSSTTTGGAAALVP